MGKSGDKGHENLHIAAYFRPSALRILEPAILLSLLVEKIFTIEGLLLADARSTKSRCASILQFVNPYAASSVLALLYTTSVTRQGKNGDRELANQFLAH